MKRRISVLVPVISLLLACQAAAQTKKIEGVFLHNGGRVSSEFVNGKFPIRSNDGVSIVDVDGNMLCTGLKPVSGSLFGSSDDLSIKKGVFFVKDEQGRIILVDLSGKRRGELVFKKVVPFLTDNTVVELANGSLAYIDTAGRVIVSLGKDYEALSGIGDSFSQKDRLIAKKILLSREEFPPFDTNGLTYFEDFSTKKIGFANRKLQRVIAPKYKEASRFSDGLAAVQDEVGNWGYVNKKGEEVIPFDYSLQPYEFYNGRAIVASKQRKYGYINKSNELVIPAKYESCTHFYKGYALVKEGYNLPVQMIDSTGQVVVEFPKDAQFVDTHASDGYGKRRLNYDVSETLVQLVDHGKGIFKKGSSYGLIDKTGDVVLDFEYSYLGDFHQGKMLAHKYEFVDGQSANRYGVINEGGDWLLELVESEF